MKICQKNTPKMKNLFLMLKAEMARLRSSYATTPESLIKTLKRKIPIADASNYLTDGPPYRFTYFICLFQRIQ